MKDFSERLFQLMIEENLSTAQLAKNVDMSAGRISDFINRTNKPSLKNLIKLANYFCCNIDFIYGRTDRREENKHIFNFSSEKFLTRYKNLLQKKSISNRKLCENLNMNKSCLFHWQSGQVPSISLLIKLADYFGVSIDYLVGRED